MAAPDDAAQWLRHAERLFHDSELRRELARNARSYAKETFDIDRITDRFEELMLREPS